MLGIAMLGAAVLGARRMLDTPVLGAAVLGAAMIGTALTLLCLKLKCLPCAVTGRKRAASNDEVRNAYGSTWFRGGLAITRRRMRYPARLRQRKP